MRISVLLYLISAVLVVVPLVFAVAEQGSTVLVGYLPYLAISLVVGLIIYIFARNLSKKGK